MKICDAHTDFLTEIKDKDEREKYVRQISKVADIISCAIYTTNSTISVKDVENFKLEIEEYNNKYHTNLLLSIEDLGFIRNTTDLTRLIQLKPVSVTLTWNEKNQFAVYHSKWHHRHPVYHNGLWCVPAVPDGCQKLCIQHGHRVEYR